MNIGIIGLSTLSTLVYESVIRLFHKYSNWPRWFGVIFDHTLKIINERVLFLFVYTLTALFEP